TESCGLLAKDNGPFRDCRAKVDPKPYLDNCVYDVCLAQGFQALLCQAMKAYSEACQREGVKVYDWRTPARCPLPCPENSHYEACGSACPATCSDPPTARPLQTPVRGDLPVRRGSRAERGPVRVGRAVAAAPTRGATTGPARASGTATVAGATAGVTR
uniref:von Willebrand factor-like n=1 Tax=Pristiophorus japonicus TaxID=55135 RepID=UPI00398E5503